MLIILLLIYFYVINCFFYNKEMTNKEMTSSDGTNPNERGVGLDTLLATRLDEDEVRALTTVMFGS